MIESQLEVNWPEVLHSIVVQINPIHCSLFKAFPIDYYWTVHQSEWATDIMFRDSAALTDLYPALVHHGITTFGSPDVMRFLGRKPMIHPAFSGQVVSDYKDRTEGVRVKHRLNHNSIKVYDKEGSILRVETTINDPHGCGLIQEPIELNQCQCQGERIIKDRIFLCFLIMFFTMFFRIVGGASLVTAASRLTRQDRGPSFDCLKVSTKTEEWGP